VIVSFSNPLLRILAGTRPSGLPKLLRKAGQGFPRPRKSSKAAHFHTATAQHSGAWPVRMQYGMPTGVTNP
jgi:hypothetical protein